MISTEGKRTCARAKCTCGCGVAERMFGGAEFMPRLVDLGTDKLFEVTRPKEHEMLTDLLVALLRRNAYTADDFVAGLRTKTDILEDLRWARCSARQSPSNTVP